MTAFDLLRAKREEVRSVLEIRAALITQERNAEGRVSEAEAELNACRKLRGYADIHIERLRTELSALEGKP